MSMSISDDLFLAILAMDSYNRGYNQGLSGLGGVGNGIGDATLSREDASTEAVEKSFYAAAYSWKGQQVISYRGTDDRPNDALYGWAVALGQFDISQTRLAAEFYKVVAGGGSTQNLSLGDLYAANITLTGHSLGGALAGFIGSIYSKTARIFDPAAFTSAANELVAHTDGSSSLQLSSVRDRFFLGSFPNAANNAGVKSYVIEGETLTSAPIVDFPGAPLSFLLPSAPYSLGFAGIISPNQRHSQALLVVRMYAEEAGLGSDWLTASRYIFPHLFDETVATTIGLSSAAGGTDTAAGKMLTKIAYSAIDDGTLLYGKTGIRALYNDATDLGKAIGASNASTTLSDLGDALGKIGVQYAGFLANAKDENMSRVSGVFTFDTSQKLLIGDLGVSTWTIGDFTTPRIIGRDELIGKILANNSNGLVENVSSLMSRIWNDSSGSRIDRLIFLAENDAFNGQMPERPSGLAGDGISLFATGGGDDVILGTSRDEIIFGARGADTIVGGNGNDLLAGGAGTDTISGGAGKDIIAGGSESDVLDGDGDDDYLLGGDGADIIRGGSDNDEIRGGDGDDRLLGGQGDDLISAGAQNDTIFADQNNDKIYGEAGIDTLRFKSDPEVGIQQPWESTGIELTVATTVVNSPIGYKVNLTLSSEETGVDDVAGVELIELTDEADRVRITQFLKPTDELATDALVIDALGQGIGTKDRAEFRLPSGGVYLKPGAGGTIEVFADAKFQNSLGLRLRNFEEIDTGPTNDDVKLPGVGLNVFLGDGEDTLSRTGAQTIVYGGDGADRIEISHSGQLLFADASTSDRMTMYGWTLTGGIQWGDSIYAYGKMGERYGRNSNGDLIIKDWWGNETFIPNFNFAVDGGANRTAGLYVINLTMQAYRLVETPVPWDLDDNMRDLLGHAMKALVGQSFYEGVDPLVLDLDGDGIELTARTSISTKFDMDGDGFAEPTGWVRSDDGLLVHDANGNGEIDDISELFGNAQNSGFAELAALDHNSDGKVDENDIIDLDSNGVIDDSEAAPGQLRIWRDFDQDGRVDAGELFTLAELGIASISTGAVPQTGVMNANNIIAATGTYTRTDDTTGQIADVRFRIDNFNTEYLGAVEPSAAALALPEVKGTGTLPDLRVAMTLTPSLQAVVSSNLSNLNTSDVADLREAAMPILLAWANAVPVNGTELKSHSDVYALWSDGENPAVTDFLIAVETETESYWTFASGRQIYDEENEIIAHPTLAQILASDDYEGTWQVIDGNEIAFLERHLGEDIPLGLSNLELGSESIEAAITILNTLTTRINLIALRLAVQGPLATYFEGIEYDAASNRFIPTTDDGLVPTYQKLLASAPSGNEVAWLSEWVDVLRVVLSDYQRPDDLILTYSYQFACIVAAYENLSYSIPLASVAGALGLPEDLIVTGGATLTGSADADLIYFNGVDQTADGGLGPDTYVVGQSFGNIVIDDHEAVGEEQLPDILRFAHFNSNDVTAVRDGIDLILMVNSTGEQILIKEQFIGEQPSLTGLNLLPDRGVKQIVFADGVVWNAFEIAHAVSHPDSTNQTIIGTRTVDVLDGGAGNDHLEGKNEGDVYYFGAGYGHDTIREGQDYLLLDTPDIVRFKPGLSIDDVIFSRAGNSEDLLISTVSGDDTLTVENQFDATYTGPFGTYWYDRIEAFVFDGGEYIAWDELLEQLVAQGKTAGSDVIYGFSYEDVLDGGQGNDWLSGGNENDTYVFGYGYGVDTIKEGADNILGGMTDTIRFSADLSLNDATFSRVGSSDDLLISFTSGDAVLVEGQFHSFSSGPFGTLWFDRVENFVFSATDTTVSYEEIMDTVLLNAKTSGNDTIYGYYREDILDGGQGNDYLAGGGEGDTYRWGAGAGNDVIFDQSSGIPQGADIDVVELSEGVVSTDLTFARAAGTDDLVITITTTGETLTIQDQFLKYATGPIYTEIEELRFADETVLTAEDLRELVLAQTKTSGDDTIVAFHTADTIDGGAGNDTLVGNGGGDTFVFGRGYGQDIVNAYIVYVTRDEPDRVLFNADVAPEDIVLSRSGDDLILSISGTDDRLTITNHFSSLGYHKVEEFHFADSTIWTATDVQNRLLVGTSGNDTLLGGTDADYLDGGAGNDLLKGRGGDDTYVFGIGYGRDVIDDDNNSLIGDAPDRLLFGPGIALEDLEFVKVGTEDLLIRIIGTEDEVTIKRHYFQSVFSVSNFELADGTKFTAADIETYIAAQGSGIVTHRGTSAAETIEGTGEADIIDGRGGADTLQGAWGSDTYLFGAGSGNDIVNENGLTTDVDTIRLVGLNPSDVLVGRNGSDLFITIISSNETLKVSSHFDGQTSGIEQLVFADTTAWDRTTIQAQAITLGTNSAETINGTGSADVIDGLGGADTLQGGTGDDTYIWRIGSGNDTIIENGLSWDVDKLKLIGVNPADVTLGRSGDHLLVTINSTGEQIKVQEHFDGTNWGIEQIIFGDNTTWDRTTIQANAALFGTSSAETINGTSSADIIDGLGGDDTLQGGWGGDTYIYRVGSGNDTIIENGLSGDVDKLKLVGLNPADVTLSRTADHLFVTIISTGEQIKVQEHFDGTSWGIEELIFGDNTTWDRATIQANAVVLGTNSAETITGSSGADTIDGRGGNDNLNGGAGGDTYIYGVGSGNDTIGENSDGAATDKVRLTGLSPTDVTFSRTSDHLFITIVSTGEQLKITDHFYSTTYGVEQLIFDGNVVWDRMQVLLQVPQLGTSGNDSLFGTSGDNAFNPGLGNDTTYSGLGSDVHIYASGDGNDKIDEESSSTTEVDTLWFTDINPNDITLTRVGNDLMVNVTATGHQIELDEQYWNATQYYGIEQFRFANGTTWNRDQIMQNAWWNGTSGNDTLSGWASFDQIDGGSGNDTISGNDGDDTLVGGAGDDMLSGGSGNDVFVFETGFGNDTITDFAGGSGVGDILEFRDGLIDDFAELLLLSSQVGSNTVITIDGSNSITLQNVTLANLNQDDFRFF